MVGLSLFGCEVNILTNVHIVHCSLLPENYILHKISTNVNYSEFYLHSSISTESWAK